MRTRLLVKVVRFNMLFAAIALLMAIMASSAAAIPISNVIQLGGEITASQWGYNPRGLVTPFSVGDHFALTASYIYDQEMPGPDPGFSAPAIGWIDFSYQFSVGGLTLTNGSGGVFIDRGCLLSLSNFSFMDEIPLVSPGFSEVPVDAFGVSTSSVSLLLMAGDTTRGYASGVITSATMTTSNPAPVPEPSTLLLIGSSLAGLAGFKFRNKQSV